MADQSRDKANAEFKKTQRSDGKDALAIAEAQAAATREKTARLRALRLARDAALPPASPKRAAAPKKSAKATKSASEKLSDWLQDQQKSGRNS
jgi:hypothetical protein